ncbi:MAG TPA: DUF892 family protein [Aquaticitalea sp.]|nr:DUF892 family protein [Aquaticitalea sp.]
MKLMIDLFEKQLQNLYNSEVLVLASLPLMYVHATDESLRAIINFYTEETDRQKTRLEEIGEYLKIKIAINDGKVIKGLLDEAKELYEDFPKGKLLDAGIISKLQNIAHFQISAYETAMLITRHLGIKEVTKKLGKTLDEAYEADEYCSEYAAKLLLPKNI